MTRPLSKHNQQERDKAIARAKHIAKLRNDGETFVEIGMLFGISAQRAQQLYAKVTALRNVK
jgi:DNA-directed RNA polymerase sigma subunit (sigma70/sigma32)